MEVNGILFAASKSSHHSLFSSVEPIVELVEVLWEGGGPAVRRHPAHPLQGLILHRGRVGHRAVNDAFISLI